MGKVKTTLYIPSPYREMLDWLISQEEDRSESSVVRLAIKLLYQQRGGPPLDPPATEGENEIAPGG